MKFYCIYFLIKDHKIVYIGASRNLDARLKAHKYDKPHDSVRVIDGLSRSTAFKYEARWIKKFRPLYNKGWMPCGRKAKVRSAEKVILVGFYTKKKVVDKAGGMQQARETAKNYLEGKFRV